MRILVVALLAAAVLSPIGSARALDPAQLVLRQADLPSGFLLESAKSGVRTALNVEKGIELLNASMTGAGSGVNGAPVG